MNEALDALVAELRRLKREGVTTVSVAEESLQLLRAAVAGSRATDWGALADGSGTRAAAGFDRAMSAADQRVARTAQTPAASKPGMPDTINRLPEPPVLELPAGPKPERWDWLRRRVLECPVCNAHTHGKGRVVFGVGDIDASIVFCGEAPGADEEVKGEPFVGPAGKLLTRMIKAMGLEREQVYIANILNWRPEMEGRLSGREVRQVGNRPPTEAEMRFCLPYLRAQLEVIQPKVIVALGSTAAQGLLGFGTFKSLGQVRGRWHEFNGAPLMITYHPSYLLRNTTKRQKRVVWEDLMQVMERVGLPISEKQRGFFL